MEGRLSPLRTYREFVASQRDDADPETFSRRYGDYRRNYGKEVVRRFFERSSDFQWFRERYDPKELCSRILQRRDFAKDQAQMFKDEFQNDGTPFDIARKASLDPRRDFEEEEETSFEASFQFSATFKAGGAVQIWNVPPSATRAQLEYQLSVALEDLMEDDDEPDAYKFTLLVDDASQRKKIGFENEAWLLFSDPSKAAAVENALSEARIDIAVPPAIAMAVMPWPKANPGLIRDRAAKMKARECQERETFRPRAKRSLVTASTSGVDDFGRGARAKRYPRPFCSYPGLSAKKRIITDARKATNLCAKFDALAEIPDELKFANFLSMSDLVRRNALARLDVAAAYLRRVHLFLYYSATQCRSEIDLLARDAPFFTRHVPAQCALDDDDELALDAATTEEPAAEDEDMDEALPGILVEMDSRIDDILHKEEEEKKKEPAVPTEEEEGAPVPTTSEEPDEEKKPEEEEETEEKKMGLAAKLARETWSYEMSELLEKEAQVETTEVEEAIDDFVRNHSVEEDQGRTRCAFEWCHKLFKSEAFLRKHLINRHADYLEAWLAPVKRPFMWTLYLADESKPLPPVRGEHGVDIDPASLIQGPSEPRRRPQRDNYQPPPRSQNRTWRKGDPIVVAPKEDHRPPDPRKLTSYADVDAPKRALLDLDFGVLLPPPPAKRRKSSKKKTDPTTTTTTTTSSSEAAPTTTTETTTSGDAPMAD